MLKLQYNLLERLTNQSERLPIASY